MNEIESRKIIKGESKKKSKLVKQKQEWREERAGDKGDCLVIKKKPSPNKIKYKKDI